MRLLCCGDSLVNGFPFPRANSFPSLIAEEMGIEVRNIGMNGITATDTAHFLSQELRKNAYDAAKASE
jgi:lysophospholipase L1-like esterase